MRTDKIASLPDSVSHAYCVMDSGVDGTSPEKCLYATHQEHQLIELSLRDEPLAHRTFQMVTFDHARVRKLALAKLDGLERLALGLPNWIDETYPPKKA